MPYALCPVPYPYVIPPTPYVLHLPSYVICIDAVSSFCAGLASLAALIVTSNPHFAWWKDGFVGLLVAIYTLYSGLYTILSARVSMHTVCTSECAITNIRITNIRLYTSDYTSNTSNIHPLSPLAHTHTHTHTARSAGGRLQQDSGPDGLRLTPLRVQLPDKPPTRIRSIRYRYGTRVRFGTRVEELLTIE
jgi:hypothetical protein